MTLRRATAELGINGTRILFALILVSVFSLSASADHKGIRPYWTYEEFSELHPHKQTHSNAFTSSVRSAGRIYQGQSNEPVRIAIIYPGKQTSDYWRRSVSSFEARLAESRVPYEIRTYFSKPGTELKLQERQIAKALTYDPNYLIFTLDALKHRVIIERLTMRQQPNVILQNITTPLKQWGTAQPFMYVGFDHAAGTEILADEYLKKYAGKGRFAIFYGSRGYVSQMRGGTFKARMLNQPEIQLVAEYYTGFNRENSRKAARQLLEKHQDLDFIFSSSTDITLGILDAIKESGKQGRVVTNGWGGGSNELQALTQGELDMTVMRINDDNGAAMAEAIQWQLRGKIVPTVYSGDMLLVTNKMTTVEIQNLTKRAFRYSDAWTSDPNQILRSNN
jgi:autoinducer 2-binding protein LuxP